MVTALAPVTLSMYPDGLGGYRSAVPNTNASISGIQITSQRGTPTVSTGFSKSILGQSITSVAGSLSTRVSSSVALTGVAITSGQGTVTRTGNDTTQLTGITITSGRGTVIGLTQPVAPSGLSVSNNANGTVNASWTLNSTNHTTLSLQIWKSSTSSWVDLVNLDSSLTTTTASNVAVPGSTGATANGSGEYGFQVRVSNSLGISYSTDFWVVVTTGGTGGGATNRGNILTCVDADDYSVGAANMGGIYWGTNNNGRVITSSNPYTGKSRSIRVQFVADTEWQQGFFWEDISGPLGLVFARFDTMWFSFRVRVPSGVDWSAPGVELKWVHTREEDNRGLYTNMASDGRITWNNAEFVGGTQAIFPLNNGDNRPTANAWTTIEMQVVFDSVPLSSGGQAVTRMWQNGIPLGQITQYKTLSSATTRHNQIRWISNWNAGGPHSTFYVEVDDVCVAVKKAGVRDDTTWMATDTNGIKYIGI